MIQTATTARRCSGNDPEPSALASARQPTDAELDQAATDLATGDLRQTLDRITAILGQSPNHPRALGMLGQLTMVMGQPASALALLQRAAALDPRLDHQLWLAMCLEKLGCREDALSVATIVAKTMPPTANARFAVGMVLHALDRHQDAARFYAGCIALDPLRSDAHHRHGRALHAVGDIVSAIEAYTKAVHHQPANPSYHADLSSALSDLGRFEEALTAAQTAVELDPRCVIGHNNHGHALHNLNRCTEALAAYETAIGLDDTYARAHFGYAVALLKSGDFARGWPQYEWRWRDCQTPRLDLAVPLWTGQPIANQTILLHAEQGFGDTLQFVRFAPLIAARGAQVVLEVPAPLVRLLRSVEGVTQVIACGNPLPPIDLHCPMASLPLAFRGTIPASPYLHTPAVHPQPEADLIVGLVWAGDPRQSQASANLIDRRRSTTLETFNPLFEIHGIRFISFQFGKARDQIATSQLPITDAMNDIADFADTARILAQVDLLISVDTSMVHLAGGLGIPVWMLSRFDGCWRWLERRDDTPWYPSMRIFRQSSQGDWPATIAAVGSPS